MRNLTLMTLLLMAEASEGSSGGAPAASPETAGSTRKAKPKAEVETVEMEDGRKVEFAGKRKLLKDSIFAADGSIDHIRLDFRNGKTVNFVIPPALLAQFAAHGAEQKLGDETAGEDDVDDMVEGVTELVARLEKGEWSTRREGGGMAGTSVLLKALVEKSGKPVEHIRTFLSTKSQAEKMALRNSAQLKPIVDRLEAEKLAKNAKVDTDALLASL